MSIDGTLLHALQVELGAAWHVVARQSMRANLQNPLKKKKKGSLQNLQSNVGGSLHSALETSDRSHPFFFG